MYPPESGSLVWTIVLRADGTVDLVAGGAPSTWAGHRFDDLGDAPALLVDAARALLELPPAPSGLRSRHLSCTYEGQSHECELLLLEGLPLRRTLVMVDDLLLRTLDTFITQARSSDVDMRLERAKDLPPVLFVDGEKLAWTLATLVGNALRAFAPDTRGHTAHIVLAASWHEASKQLELAVRDNGRGMPESQVRWLFDRDPSTGRSAGLALTMVRDVVAAHRGTVTAVSQVGVGTTITLRIPRLHA